VRNWMYAVQSFRPFIPSGYQPTAKAAEYRLPPKRGRNKYASMALAFWSAALLRRFLSMR
jgi:hypothetical protein